MCSLKLQYFIKKLRHPVKLSQIQNLLNDENNNKWIARISTTQLCSLQTTSKRRVHQSKRSMIANGVSSTFKSDYHLKHYDNSYFKLRKSEAVGISYEKRGENGSFRTKLIWVSTVHRLAVFPT